MKGRKNPSCKSLHPLWDTWRGMIKRCHNPKHRSYERYGARGIKVCGRWRAEETGFWNFVHDMGPKPSPEHQIEREDNDKGYGPFNCVWATPLEQSKNKRRQKADKGYCWHEKTQNWQAIIQINKVRKSLGYYDTEDKARQAYLDAYAQLV